MNSGAVFDILDRYQMSALHYNLIALLKTKNAIFEKKMAFKEIGVTGFEPAAP